MRERMSDIQWLTAAIEEMAKTGIREDGEYWRASYTPEDRKAVQLLRSYMESAGMETYFDAAGNLFGRYEGRGQGVILSGSHRDTVRQGGKYDGMLGVLSAVRAAASLHAELGQPEKTLEVVAVCEEESSRFPVSYLGSHHICGELTEADLAATDREGISLEQAMKEHGYLHEPLSKGKPDLEHFVELHIEQGGVLEHEKKQIGIVSSIVGLYSGDIVFSGHQNHAGTTPMALRKDPVPAAALYITKLFDWAKQHMDDMVCTIGRMETKPGSVNVIPDTVTISFDIRSENPKLLQEAQSVLCQLKAELEGDIRIELRSAYCEQPVLLDQQGVNDLERLAAREALTYVVMPSGAGHDSQVIGRHYRTNMIFVPSAEGISHSPREFTRTEDLASGLKLLKAYLKELAWRRDR